MQHMQHMKYTQHICSTCHISAMRWNLRALGAHSRICPFGPIRTCTLNWTRKWTGRDAVSTWSGPLMSFWQWQINFRLHKSEWKSIKGKAKRATDKSDHKLSIDRKTNKKKGNKRVKLYVCYHKKNKSAPISPRNGPGLCRTSETTSTESEKEEERLKLVDNLLHYQIHRFIFKKARQSFHSHVWHSPLGPLQASKERFSHNQIFNSFFCVVFAFHSCVSTKKQLSSLPQPSHARQIPCK